VESATCVTPPRISDLRRGSSTGELLLEVDKAVADVRCRPELANPAAAGPDQLHVGGGERYLVERLGATALSRAVSLLLPALVSYRPVGACLV
jgi:hypothetical protein